MEIEEKVHFVLDVVKNSEYPFFMKLSEYICRLQAIKRGLKGADPEMVEGRWSDIALLQDDDGPGLLEGIERVRGEEGWITDVTEKDKERMAPEEKAKIKRYVMR